MKKTFFLAVLALLQTAHAEVRLAGLFSDGMVLQQGQPVPVWGWAEAGEKVSVEFAGQKQSCVTAGDGRWQVTLERLAASAEGRPLTVSGRNSVALKDVVVGEVWLCAGQSNMAMSLAEADGGPEEMKQNDPLLRSFRVPERPGERPFKDVNARWLAGSRAHWSATPYFFGKHLRGALGVPVGVIVSAWGGSSGVTWVSPAGLDKLGPLVPEEVIGWPSNRQHSRLYHGMLSPLVPFAVAGVVWYQGETEADPSQNPFLYRQIFPTLIEDWRTQWNRPEMPFYWVQLPNLRDKPLWPIVRESQAAALALPFTGMIPAVDIGQETQLHPTNKKQFGERLGNLVLAKSYGRNTWPGAATFKALKRQVDGSIRLQLADAAGLKTSDGAAPACFEVAAADGEFRPAQARIEGEEIVLTSSEVQNPAEVRYAWDANPKVNVVNGAGLPLVPFRTDSRPMPGQEWHWEPLAAKAEWPFLATGRQLAEESAAGWRMRLEGIDKPTLDKLRMIRMHGDFCQVVCADLIRGSMKLASPRIFWEAYPQTTKTFDAQKGVTVEVKVQMYRATDPFRGFDVEVGLPRPEGGFRRYLLSILPMRLYAYQGKEIHLLGSNLDNMTDPHTYRIAIRGDGMAQVFYDGAPIGLFEGEVVEGGGEAYLRVGKLADRGEFTANLHEVGIDPTGAFAK